MDPVAAIQPWIAGLHYDNSGVDVDEQVTLAGLAGTRLADYELVFYNGNDGEMYGRTLLTGWISDDSEKGYGTVDFGAPDEWQGRSASIQNGKPGDPDGIALVSRLTNEVVEFISYEGVFEAKEGPAKGLTSVDIEVRQSGSTEVGDWLYKDIPASGTTGQRSSDFVWRGTTDDTPFTGYPFADAPDEYRLPWISEIVYRAENERVTVCGPPGIDLSKFELILYNGAAPAGRVYDLQYLEGTTSVASDGCVSTSIELQNGTDGVALVRRDDRYVVEFLSYGPDGELSPSGTGSGLLNGLRSEHISATQQPLISTVTRTERNGKWTVV